MSARPFALASFWVACAAPAPGSDVTAVDVVVSAPAAPERSSAPATKVATDEAPVASVNIEDPRRVLLPPPLQVPSGVAVPSRTPPTAGALAQTSQAALAAAIGQTISTSSPGMAPDGASVGGTFKQGDTLHLPLVLQPGRCYTIVAIGRGITELDLELMVETGQMGIPLPPTTLAVDISSGPTAVIGPGTNCWKSPLPVPLAAIAVVRAAAGAGTAVAQAFVK